MLRVPPQCLPKPATAAARSFLLRFPRSCSRSCSRGREPVPQLACLCMLASLSLHVHAGRAGHSRDRGYQFLGDLIPSVISRERTELTMGR